MDSWERQRKYDEAADKAVTKALKYAKLPISMPDLRKLAQTFDKNVSDLEVTQAAWRLIGAHKYDLTDDMKLGPYDKTRFRW